MTAKARTRRRIAVVLAFCCAVWLPALALAGPPSSPDAVTGAARRPGPATTAPATTAAPTTSTTADPLGSGQPVTFAFGGDVAFEGAIAERLAADPASVFALVAPTLASADLAVVNLETAVTDGGTPAPKQFTFRAPTTAWSALEAAGVDVVSVANNHGMDFGVDGLQDTLEGGDASGVAVIGGGMTEDEAYEPFTATVNGQRIAVIAATQVLDSTLIDEWTAGDDQPGLASAKQVWRLTDEVRRARAAADTVVVFLHWGIEQQSCPSGDQQQLAAALTAAGADIVVGGHAHRTQGAGMLGEAFVAYGLGNFTFLERTPASAHTGVLLVTATGRRIDGWRWEPGVLSAGLHHPLEGDEAAAAVEAWEALRECTDLSG